MPDAQALARKFEVLARVLDERTRRLVAAAEAEAMGFGGISAVAEASGLSRGTVIRGMVELKTAAKPKTLEGSSPPDRDAQFHHIRGKIREFQVGRQPVISVDTKKKELVGNFKNNGRELRPQGDPEKVRVHDFVIPELGRAAPYGVYDVTQNAGWVSVGVDHDIAAFAAQVIRRCCD